MKKYSRDQIGCILDGNVRSEEEIIKWFESFGFKPDPYTEEQINDPEYRSWLSDDIADGIDWMNDHMCDPGVHFESDCDGSILLIEPEYYHVSDIPDDYVLVDLSQDIKALCESIGLNYDDYSGGCFFVLIGEGEYESVYYCDHSVPHLDYNVERINIW